MSVVSGAELEAKIIEELPASVCQVLDESDGCGQKYLITVVSDSFKGKPLIAQHRAVNKVCSFVKNVTMTCCCLCRKMIQVIEVERKNIHAITLKTMTPEVWESSKATTDE